MMSNTNELIVDVRGSLCPKPVIETKKVSDANPDAVEKFGKSRGYGVAIRQDGKDFYLTMTPNDNPVTDGSCEPMSYGNRVILMTKDYLGEGSEELGRNLMKTFWVCMLEADVKPSKIYFINSSVKMVVNDSVHLENIKKLADLGVEIAACGICLDYFGVKEELGVGSITNMYAITDSILGENLVKL